MTTTGFDYAWGRPGGQALADAGAQFVMRYLSADPSKNLTRAEALDLAAHGIKVGVVWETTASRALAGYDAGQADAAAALAQAHAVGMPAGAPIYFAVDFDARATSDQNTVGAYFDGVNQVLSPAETGVYGGYSTVQFITATGKASYAWQTTAWSDGQWYDGANIRQAGGNAEIGGVDCDRNTGYGNEGTWYPEGSGQPAVPAAPAWPGRYLELTEPFMSGDDVRDWQKRMSERGWSIVVDGWYGPESAGVCRAFQQDKGLVVDGIVGPVTWAAAWTAPVTP